MRPCCSCARRGRTFSTAGRRAPREADGLRLHLEPLSADAAGLILENLLGGNGIPAALRARIVTAAEGNPLFVEQVLSMLIDDGLLRQANGSWEAAGDLTDLAVPATIHSLMAARLDGLSDEERAVIEAAAVGGYEFPQAALEVLVGDPLRARVGESLAALSRKQLLQPAEEDAHVGPQFRFQHIVIRDAAYARLLKETRVSLHEKFVEWADGVVADRGVAYDEILGWHLEEAYRNLAELGPLDAHGIELGVRAADRLSGRRPDGRSPAGTCRPPRTCCAGRARCCRSSRRRGSNAFPTSARRSWTSASSQKPARVLDEAIDARRRSSATSAFWPKGRLVRLLVARHAADAEGLGRGGRAARRERARPAVRGCWRPRAAGTDVAPRSATSRDRVPVRRGRRAAAEQAIEHARLAGDVRQEARAVTTYATAALHGPTPVDEAIRRCEEIVGAGAR